jgi:hypothetical protein
MLPIRILKISLCISISLLLIAFVIWGIRMTNAVGNLYIEVQALHQRVNILTSKGSDGTSENKVP